ncbi:hypothetical protein V1264_017351 [Littorina saxatilis]|uniref:Uncharacterized protein n=1 Tax=Littorina saxatilis TaxID=31220 RepID=A0AAN9BJ12_9CAEN
MCTLTDILGSCNSTGDCRCGTGNSSHYLFEYEFTAATNKEGYWDCLLPCDDVGFYLSFQEFDCGNRKVYENPNRLKQELTKSTDDLTECKNRSRKEALKSCPTPTDFSPPNTLVIGLGVIGAACVVMAAVVVGVYIGTQRSGSHQNAPPNNAPLNKAHPNNAPPNNAHPNNAHPNNIPQDNAPLANGPPFNSPAFNSPPDNDPQVAVEAGPSTGFASIPEAELDDSSADASEAREGSEFTASGVGKV